MHKVWIGASGWTYEGWRGPFYPKDLPKKDWLLYYATRFPTTLERWATAIATWRSQKREVLVYFDNDQKAAAPRDAERLLAILDD
jgi:uncharacterized protein YecE (DUF72 family)